MVHRVPGFNLSSRSYNIVLSLDKLKLWSRMKSEHIELNNLLFYVYLYIEVLNNTKN